MHVLFILLCIRLPPLQAVIAVENLLENHGRNSRSETKRQHWAPAVPFGPSFSVLYSVAPGQPILSNILRVCAWTALPSSLPANKHGSERNRDLVRSRDEWSPTARPMASSHHLLGDAAAAATAAGGADSSRRRTTDDDRTEALTAP